MLLAFVWRSWKSADLAPIEYFKINIISKSPFLYEYDTHYLKKPTRFGIFLNNTFVISEYKIFKPLVNNVSIKPIILLLHSHNISLLDNAALIW